MCEGTPFTHTLTLYLSFTHSPEVYGELYAFQYRPDSSTLKQRSGWMVYDAEAEYRRMGVPNEHWTATKLNENYEVCCCYHLPHVAILDFSLHIFCFFLQLCDTYSCDLYVPTCATNETIMGSAKFRSKGRLPILSFYYSPQQVSPPSPLPSPSLTTSVCCSRHCVAAANLWLDCWDAHKKTRT